MKTTIAAAMLALSGSAAAQDLIYAGFSSETVGELDASTGATSNVQPLFGAATEVFALATQPISNAIFAMGTSGKIVTVNTFTGEVTEVVELHANGIPFFLINTDITRVSGLTFSDDGTLWGIVTQDAGKAFPVVGTIFTVNISTGECTDSGFTPAGAGGHTLEYNPDDGLLYNFFQNAPGGSGTAILRTIDPNTGVSTPVPYSGDPISGAINSAVYVGGGEFYAYSINAGTLYSITTGGVVTELTTSTADAHGLTLSEYVEPCPADINIDGVASPADFTAWLGCFTNPMDQPFCHRADVNNSGLIEPSDFTAWLAAFNNGCP